MIALSCAMLAAPLMAVAVAASSPVGSFAALLAPFQPQGSGLHARQVMVPSECFSICDPVITSINDCISSQCACTTQHMNELASCMECTVTVTQSGNNLVNGQGALLNFGEKCAGDGYPLSVPTVTAATPGATRSLSGGNSPTQTTPNQSPPPTGIPLSLGVPSGGASAPSNGTTPTTQAVAAPQGSQSGGGGTGHPNGAPRVGNREITSLLFSLCLLVLA